MRRKYVLTGESRQEDLRAIFAFRAHTPEGHVVERIGVIADVICAHYFRAFARWLSVRRTPLPTRPRCPRQVFRFSRCCEYGVRDAACPLSTRGGTRLVRLVRGRGGGVRFSRCCDRRTAPRARCSVGAGAGGRSRLRGAQVVMGVLHCLVPTLARVVLDYKESGRLQGLGLTRAWVSPHPVDRLVCCGPRTSPALPRRPWGAGVRRAGGWLRSVCGAWARRPPARALRPAA